MAAPRKYSTAQRQEIYRLHEAGMTSQQISDACAKGTAGATAFEIPRRSVSAVIKAMDREAGRQLPSTIEDAGTLESVHRFPERIARIFDAELNRLEIKQRRGKLTAKDMDVLKKATEITRPLKARLEGSTSRPEGATGRQGAAPAKEDAIEKLAREMAGENGAAERPAQIHTRPTSEVPDLPGASEWASAEVPVATKTPRGPLSPADRASVLAAARKAAEDAAVDEGRRQEIAAGFDQAEIGGGSGSLDGAGSSTAS